MFEPIRENSTESANPTCTEKATFKLEIRASNVPDWWGDLQVSMVALNTGKVTAQTVKVPVDDGGSCQWPEQILQLLDHAHALCKLVVSSDSSRLRVLGDTTIDLVEHLHTTVVDNPVSLPLLLQNCKHGSLLHVKIWRVMNNKSSERYTVHGPRWSGSCGFGGEPEQNRAPIGLEGEANEDEAFSLRSTSSCHSLYSVDVPSTPGGSWETPDPYDDSDHYLDLEVDGGGRRRRLQVSFSSSSPRSSGRLFDAAAADAKNCSQVHHNSQTIATRVQVVASQDHETVLKQDASRFARHAFHEDATLSHGLAAGNKRRLVNSQRRNHLQHKSSAPSYDQPATEDHGCIAAAAEIVKLKQQLSSEMTKREQVEKSLSSLLRQHESVKKELLAMERLKPTMSSSAILNTRQRQSAEAQESVLLKDEIAYLQSVNSNLSFQLQKTQESNLALLSEIQELEKTVQQQKKELEDSSEAHVRREEMVSVDLRKRVEMLQNEVKDVAQKNRELAEANASLTAKRNDANEESKEKSERIAELEDGRGRASATITIRELQSKVLALEEELEELKLNAALVASTESAAEDLDDAPEPQTSSDCISRSLSCRSVCNRSRIGPKSSSVMRSMSREAKKTIDRRQKVRLLEEEVKKKGAELETSKHQSCELQKQLSLRIEDLQLANQRLVDCPNFRKRDLNALKAQITDLQNQNSILSRHENDLSTRLASKEIELETLKKGKRELENALSKSKAYAEDGCLIDRILSLEDELAEVVDANNMYKLQLHSAYAKHQIVSAVALENLESVEQVIKDLTEMKRKNRMLEDEVCDLNERYFSVSIQFAEVVAERDELMNTLRGLRGGGGGGNKKKLLLSHRSLNFFF